jgi:membrane fusion protein (multidrug efflux system)
MSNLDMSSAKAEVEVSLKSHSASYGDPRMDKQTSEKSHNQEQKKAGITPKTRKMIAGVAAGVVAIGGGYLGYQSYFYVSTDNAMIQAPTTLLSSKVGGLIVTADVQENQKVKAGQTLVEIRPDDYQNVLNQLDSEKESLAAQLKGAQSTYQRALDLYQKGASTKERVDTTEAQYRSLDRKLKSAQAQVAQAKLNLDYTKITAPVDGKVGRKSFEVGMLASPGQPLLGFVAGNERWVVANLKETDLDHIAEGEKAYISVDAISGKEFEGVVESISPSTGATFSLLPPDNATGNFTKVIQRVPVRIKLLNLSEHDIDRLQSGLSAEIKIKIH